MFGWCGKVVRINLSDHEFSVDYPDAGILSEEEDYTRKPSDGETYFVIDPIDGTSMFVSGLSIWGIAIGVIKSGIPIAGFFYMPATDDF